MTWTDERVALLKKLWMEGLSASQIAAELSGGVTRNAVIGKVHRLKLSARAKPASVASRAKTPRPAAPRRPTSSPGVRGTASTAASAVSQRRSNPAPVIGATALKIDTETQPQMAVEIAEQPAELFIPVAERISLLQLTEKTCKWPIGDPVSSEFHFCGRDAEENKPYCEFHSKRAYHQLERRRR